MPLHKIELTEYQCGWGVWNITESESELAENELCPSDISNVVKRTEWYAGRMLMKNLVEKAGLIYHGMYKDDFGKPYLNDHPHHVSLSHSYPHVAAQLDLNHPVGIDIEQPKAKLLKIAPRIFSAGELKDAGTGLSKNCIYWCAKESLYKIYGQRGLSFMEHLLVLPFVPANSGELQGRISVDGQVLSYLLIYEVNSDFVLVRTKEKNNG
jgi:4'-phosphopantetheinyl transferase